VGEGVAGWVAQRAEPVIIQDKWTDPRYKYVLELRGEDYVSFASVPTVARAGHVVGVINVHARRPGHFGAHDVSILADIANLMAGAVENARLHTRLAQREAELERFAEHTLQLHESERQRLARGDPRTG
jgi:two-component system NarL family sensor kinase